MFRDRKDAGIKLAHALNAYRDKNTLVLAIPRGGVETAYYVASYLHSDMSLVIARKLGYPSNPEAAFGAIAEDGSTYISEVAKQRLLDEEIDHELSEQKIEMERRIQKLRHGNPLADIAGKTVIIVDDGIATGATLLAVIQLCRNKKARKIVVAAPISAAPIATQLRELVDDVVILEIPRHFMSVSQGYKEFRNLTDHETLSYVTKWEQEHPSRKKIY